MEKLKEKVNDPNNNKPLDKEIAELLNFFQQLKSDLEQQQADLMKYCHQTEKARKEKENEEEKERKEQEIKYNKEKEEMRNENEKMKKYIKQLSRSMKEIEDQITIKSKENSDSKKDLEIAELKQQLNTKKREIEQKQEQIERERTEQEILRSERKELEKEQKGQDDRDRQAKEKLQNEQDFENKKLQKAVETLQDKIADLEKIKRYEVEGVTQKRHLEIIAIVESLAQTDREKIVEDESEKKNENLMAKEDDMKTRDMRETQRIKKVEEGIQNSAFLAEKNLFMVKKHKNDSN